MRLEKEVNNMDKKISSAGGQARALIQKEEAKQRIDEYNKTPNLCNYCGNPIVVPYGKKLRQTKIKKFCSKSCAAKFNNCQGDRARLKPNIDNFSDDEILEFYTTSENFLEFSQKLGYKSEAKRLRKYIAQKLLELGLDTEKIYKKFSISGCTKKELFSRYQQWQTARSAIQRDARCTYDNSDKPKQCIVCGYNKHYEVAHIKAVSDFTDDALISEINDIDNLIALCPNHHWEYDNENLDLNIYSSTQQND